jgi:hypothetical protein
MLNGKQENLILDFFARGGTINRLPTPQPTTISNVLEYLRGCNFVVYPAPRGEGQPKFVYRGMVVTEEKLVGIANEHRATQHLPPFQVVPQLN